MSLPPDGSGAALAPDTPIDCNVHNAIPRVEALFPYLPPYWVEHGATSSASSRARPATPAAPVTGRVRGPYVAETYPVSADGQYLVVEIAG